MKQIDYLNKILGDKGQLVNLDYKVLKELYKQSFQTPQMIADILEINVLDVISSCIKMQNSALNLVEISADKFLTTPEGDDVIESAAKAWIEAERPELLEVKGSRKKRDITEGMEQFKDFALEYLEGKIEVKNTVVDRSNYLILFSKRISSVGALEIKNKGEVRVVGRKPSDAIVEKLASIGMSYRQTPAQTYFDIACNEDSIVAIIDALIEHA